MKMKSFFIFLIFLWISISICHGMYFSRNLCWKCYDTNFLCIGWRAFPRPIQRTIPRNNRNNVAVLAGIAAANAAANAQRRTTVPVRGQGWRTSTTTCKSSFKKVYFLVCICFYFSKTCSSHN